MTEGVEFRDTPDGLDWAELKRDLAADHFDNGRSPEQLRDSFANSFASVYAFDGRRCVGTARLLSDGICNAYLIDVWALSSHRRHGIATRMIERLLEQVPGQHVALFTEHHPELYERLSFEEERIGMSKVVGTWLLHRD
ncbi:MAG: GNAT family N-acetyltransferase [Actinomycetota bacterium]